MKKSIRILIILNLLSYFSYLIYSCVQFNMVIKNWWVITAILPYILVISSSFIVFNNEKDKSSIFKLEAVIDLFARILALFINFSLKVLVEYPLWFNIMILAVLVLFFLNIYMEKRMYKKVVSLKEINNNPQYYDLSWEDKINFNDMDSAIRSELREIPIVIFILTTITGFKTSSSEDSIIFFGLIDICLFGYFLYHNYRALLLFYKDKKVARNIFVKGNAFVLLAIILCSIFGIFRILGYNSGIDSLLSILGMIPLYPNFVLRIKRALKVKKIRMAKQQDA